MAQGRQGEIEAQHGKPIRDVLIEQFERYGTAPNPVDAVAAALGVSQATISLWIMKLRLKRHVRLVDDDGGAGAVAVVPDGQLVLPGVESL